MSFVFVRATGRLKVHWIVGAITGSVPTGMKISDDVLTPTKFAAVMPDPCNAATTSSRLVLTSDWTDTLNTAWSGCKVAVRDAVTVIELESSWANPNEADKTNRSKAFFDMKAVYRSLFEGF